MLQEMLGEDVEGTYKSLLIIMLRTFEASQQIKTGEGSREMKRGERGVLWVSSLNQFMQEADRACWAAVHGVAQSRTRPKRLSSSSSRHVSMGDTCQ